MLVAATIALLLALAGDPRPGITGDVRMHAAVPSAVEGIRARNVVVWLPPGYDDTANADRRYPVLYMQDGQNVFDPSTAFLGREWHADEVADRLVRSGRIPPVIIVGIWNTPDRVADYTPDQDLEDQRGDNKPQGRGGNGEAYLRWIAEELKPFIDRTYRTRNDRDSTAIMGSSLGGIISLAAAELQPKVFGRVAAVSPSLWWNGGSVIERWRGSAPRPDRVWMCMGDRERAGLDDALRRFEQAIRPGPTGLGDRLHAEVVPGGTHDEPSWSARLDRILVFLWAETGWKDAAWVTPEVRAPRVSFHVFDSAAAKAKVSYHLYTPAAYGRDAEARFPVVYWLHGSGGGVAGIPPLAKWFDAAIEAGKVRPFLVVFVNGLVEGMYVDWKDGSTPIESMIVQDLVPHVDRTYRTVATREGRMLDGFSMGGYGAARLGFKFPERFRAVSMLGAGPLDPDFERTPRANPRSRDGLLTRVYGDRTYFREVSPWEIAKRNAPAIAKDSLVRVAVGDRDGTFALNEEFHRHLESLSIPHEWIPLPGVEHDPMKTLEALGERHWDFYRRAFGAPAARAARQDGEVKLAVGDAERRAIVVNVPPEGQMRPAVLILHGGSGSAERMRANAGFDPLARAEGFMAVYAEGTDFGGDRHAWNTGHLLRRQVRDADDIAYFDALIDMLVRNLGADPARIFMTGGSNGGMMTFAYAAARPGRLAAAAPVVASMFAFDRVPEVPLPILIINGAKDEEVPLEGGMSRNRVVRLAQATPFKPVTEVVDFWVKANKSVAPGTTKTDGTVTTTTYAAGDGGAVTEFVVDAAGGHGWPGTRERRAGNTPIAAFSGAERTWRFFKGKSRPERLNTQASAPRR